ncbi:MAG: hypothetical protein JHC93_07610 [Parachlamydiales bacterium]|nr:hypothetical protein [Parachlamydiales bacterium]
MISAVNSKHLNDSSQISASDKITSIKPDQLAKVESVLFQSDPIKPELIDELHNMVFDESRAYKDDIYHPFTQVERLYNAIVVMKSGDLGRPAENSSNGARLLNDSQGNPLYIFKGERLFENFLINDVSGAKREQLAYLLDKDHQAMVPPTFFVDLNEFKLGVGSLQHYRNDVDRGTLSENSNFLCDVSQIDQIMLRTIFIHDLLMINLDAGSNNLLMKNNCPIPIDFGYSLPCGIEERSTDSIPSFDDRPFTDKEAQYINQIDANSTLTLLKEHHIDESAINIQQNMILLLKSAVNTPGITLKDLHRLYYSCTKTGGGWSGDPRVFFKGDIKTILLSCDLNNTSILIQKALEKILANK